MGFSPRFLLSLTFLLVSFAFFPDFFSRLLADEEFRLEGIVEDSGNPENSLAVINGQLVQKGGSLGIYQVAAIGKNTVTLREARSGKEIFLQPSGRPPEPERPKEVVNPEKKSAEAWQERLEEVIRSPGEVKNLVSEFMAIREIAIINNAAVKYYERNRFFPVKIRQLTLDGFLPPSYEKGEVGKYRFYLSNTPHFPDDLQLHADPLDSKSNLRYFFVGPDAQVRSSTGKPADGKSPLYQYPKNPLGKS